MSKFVLIGLRMGGRCPSRENEEQAMFLLRKNEVVREEQAMLSLRETALGGSLRFRVILNSRSDQVNVSHPQNCQASLAYCSRKI